MLFHSVQNVSELYEIGRKMCEELAEHEHVKDAEEVDEYWSTKSIAFVYRGEQYVALERNRDKPLVSRSLRGRQKCKMDTVNTK